MPTIQDQKNAQKVLTANEIARSISDIDAERLAAALTLMTPSELDRLSAVVAVAGKLGLPLAIGEEVKPAEPRKARKRKEVPPVVNTTLSGLRAPAAGAPPKCIAPGCAFDAEKDETCRDHAGAAEPQKAEWRHAIGHEGLRKMERAIDSMIPPEQGRGR